MWLNTKPRRHAIRGSVKSGFPQASSDQGPSSVASFAPASALRAVARLASKVPRISARERSSSIFGTGLPGGARSKSFPEITRSPQLSVLPRCVARPPRLIDFTCGFQASCASGTRSSTMRRLVVSWSNSGSRLAESVMVPERIAIGARIAPMKLAALALLLFASCSVSAAPPGDPRVTYTVDFAAGSDGAVLQQAVERYKQRVCKPARETEVHIKAPAVTFT